MKLFQRIKKDESGSLTIEASVSMVLFSFVMVFLLTLINASRAKAIIQTSLDKAALEISQIMYLYEATGLYYETVDVTGAGQKAVDTAVSVANATGDVVDGVKDSIENGWKEGITGEVIDNLSSGDGILNGLSTLYDANAFGFVIDPVLGWLKSTDVDSGGFKDTDIADMSLSILDGGSGTLSNSYDTIKKGVNGVTDNPMQFVLSLAKYGLGTATSYYFGTCLGEDLTVKYIKSEQNNGFMTATLPGSNYEDRLTKLGVVDGCKGLNFKKSSVFAPTSPFDVNLVVTYDVAIYPLLGDFNVTFAQSACTRAWLGGDMTLTKALVIEKNRGYK